MGDRHCAYCLQSIKFDKVLLCAKCLKRAYCGRECQVKDWSLKGDGQRHKSWCGLEAGEEDVDWALESIPGKGLGLVAKRHFKANSRIMVDGLCSSKNARIQTIFLLPQPPLSEDNYLSLYFGGDKEEEGTLRLGRTNHNCDPNSGQVYEPAQHAKVLYAEREICPGEEICGSYTKFNDITGSHSPDQCRALLLRRWGISCPPSCFCRDEGVWQKVKTGRKLHSSILRVMGCGGSTEKGLALVRELLEVERDAHCSLMNRVATLYAGFEFGVMKSKTLPVALKYIEEACELSQSFLHPLSEEGEVYRDCRDHYTQHHSYLRSDH